MNGNPTARVSSSDIVLSLPQVEGLRCLASVKTAREQKPSRACSTFGGRDNRGRTALHLFGPTATVLFGSTGSRSWILRGMTWTSSLAEDYLSDIKSQPGQRTCPRVHKVRPPLVVAKRKTRPTHSRPYFTGPLCGRCKQETLLLHRFTRDRGFVVERWVAS